MNIYLNDNNKGSSIYSILKSAGRAMTHCPTGAFLLSYFYAGIGFFIKFLLSDCRLLPNIDLIDLIYGISFTLVISILST